ncbi:hypothetical protein DES53_104162 [Roseimicrobium gellanilyticum]|uniref:Uncharacterized protein n=1 Tax=Roseimicrobium gellanilyticum TaxID=748857 RepID=A0A366HMW2_9BACT|nr:hypothetical protein DES53_104162 [Roseimicrobium gellanilyticum]
MWSAHSVRGCRLKSMEEVNTPKHFAPPESLREIENSPPDRTRSGRTTRSADHRPHSARDFTRSFSALTALCAVSWRNFAYSASNPLGTKLLPTALSPKSTS